MRREVSKFAMIGSGRVATHLSVALVAGGLECMGVYSPTSSNAQTLAERLSTDTRTLAELIQLDVDFVLIAVKDDAIAELAKEFPKDYPAVVLHTSGGTSIDALAPIEHRGVLYPMQTFSPNRPLSIPSIPIFPEYRDEYTAEVIEAITSALGTQNIKTLTSDERVKLHLASVFACNFVNHLYLHADSIMHDIGLDFTLLAPLVEETLAKAKDFPPKSVQTGPAIRHDYKTINHHLSLLEGQAKEIYQVITNSIMDE